MSFLSAFDIQGSTSLMRSGHFKFLNNADLRIERKMLAPWFSGKLTKDASSSVLLKNIFSSQMESPVIYSAPTHQRIQMHCVCNTDVE